MLPFLLSLFVSIAYAQSPSHNEMVSSTAVPAVMLEIARCEGGNRQFDDDGNVVRSATNDYGLFQINTQHFKEARAMGYDPMTAEGNISYALYLYKSHGTYDWRYSQSCWGKTFNADGTPKGGKPPNY